MGTNNINANAVLWLIAIINVTYIVNMKFYLCLNIIRAIIRILVLSGS